MDRRLRYDQPDNVPLGNTTLLFGLRQFVGEDLEQMELLAGTRQGIAEIGSRFESIRPVLARAMEELSAPDLVIVAQGK